MSIRYTKKTREVLNFINEYGFITNNICGKVFYKGNKSSYTQARVILQKLFKNGDIKRYSHETTKEWIYQIEPKLIDDHRKAIIDLYAEMFLLVDTIDYFKIEAIWNISKRRSDAHIIFTKDGNTNSFLVEYERFHTTPANKIDEIKASGEVQEFYKARYDIDNYFPTLLIISPLATSKCVSSDWLTVNIDYRFEGLDSLI